MALPKRRTIVFIATALILLFSGNGVDGWTSLQHSTDDFKTASAVNTIVSPDGAELIPVDQAGITWSKISDGVPSNRSSSPMVYDQAKGQLVMFTPFGIGNSETWTFNFSSGNWTNRRPSVSPACSECSLAYDTADGAVILYANGQIWSYDLEVNGWLQWGSSNGPSATGSYAMVYDSSDKKIILYGGSDSTTSRNETWVLFPEYLSWERLYPIQSPPALQTNIMAYDSRVDRTVLFCEGRDKSGNLRNETWTFDIGNNTWNRMAPALSPPLRQSPAMAYDPSSGETILFGGLIGFQAMNDTWAYNATSDAWTCLAPFRSPTPRYNHAMSFCADPASIVVFGGLYLEAGDQGSRGDLWQFNSASDIWQDITPSDSPTGLSGSAMVSTGDKGNVLLFGGDNGDYHPVLGLLNETYYFDATESSWRNANPPATPPGRNGHAMTYDKDDGVVVMFGGQPSFNDTWTYDVSANNWTIAQPEYYHPAARYDHSMTYDPITRLVILFGGQSYQEHYGYFPQSDTWTFDVRNSTWTKVWPENAPSPRSSHAVAYDTSTGEMILFGGQTRDDYVNDTWAYNASTNTWSARSPAMSPSPRVEANLVYDDRIGACVLFGGSNGQTCLNDLWLYFVDEDRWVNCTPDDNPPPQQGRSMAYDPANDLIVLYGGDTWTCRIEPPSPGTLTSRPLDTGGSSYFKDIQWAADTVEGTAVDFQLRSSNSTDTLLSRDFIGPDGTNKTYYDVSGQRIFAGHGGDRWIQYCAYLRADRIFLTPTLKSVKINHNRYQDLALLSPVGGENWTGVQDIRWTASDPDNDTLTFDLFLECPSSSTLMAGGLAESLQRFSWNTEMVPNGTYRIRITARDDNNYIPLAVDAVSENFTVFHPPPPNKLPRVALQSPLNNSIVNTVSVRLAWRGSDPDGDPLTYEARYSAGPLEFSPVITNITASDYLDISNLADNTIYYWTVSADDGSGFQTDVPTEVWTFIVRLPAPNRPPRITSLPATSVTAGDLYQYNLNATDEDFTILRYSLITGPANMSIDNITGKLRWQTTTADIGNHTVTVRVSDTAGATDNQTFKLEVLAPPPPPQKPTCIITSPANNSRVSGRIPVRGTAQNGTRPLTIVQVRLDGGPWRVAAGLGNWSMNIDLGNITNGKHTIEARAFDGSLYSDTASVRITINNREPGTTLQETLWLAVALVVVILAAAGIFFVRRKIMS